MDKERRKKIAFTFTKALVVFVVFVAMIPVSSRNFQRWMQAGFQNVFQPYSTTYPRLVMMLIYALYLFELIHKDGFSFFLAMHHMAAISLFPVFFTGIFLSSEQDVIYYVNVVVFLIQIYSSGFVTWTGIGALSFLEHSERRKSLLRFLYWYASGSFMLAQAVGWIYFISNIENFSNIRPVLYSGPPLVCFAMESIQTSKYFAYMLAKEHSVGGAKKTIPQFNRNLTAQ